MKKIITVLFVLFFYVTSVTAQSINDIKGLSVGAKAPDFTAKDQNGKLIKLSDELKNGPVVVMFYRGQWCPYCNRLLKKVEDSLPMIKEKGATVLAITPETDEAILQTIAKTKATYSLMNDHGLKIMRSYDVAYRVDTGTVEKYKKYGIDFDKSNGSNGAYLPVPATYIVGKDGTIKYVYFNRDYKERASIKELLENL
ncbi:MAG: peroxiredoxin-like family protein [Sphingobacteriales bacterium]